jgi:4-amino-4-deoxy-L-arabinose transferase-like glycosyltransferase
MTSFTSHSSDGVSHPRARSAPRVLRWPEWLTCLVLAGLWFGCTAWLRPLAIPDEGRYVGVAWEMMSSGNWLVPTLDGMPFFHKPPLFYWITAGAMALFGPGVAAARAAAWLASLAIVSGLFAFVRRWVGREQAWASVAVLATAPLFYGAAQYANMDLLVAACISATILLIAHATLARDEGLPYHRALTAAFVAAALGILAKGLIGVVLPPLVLVVWGLATRRLFKIFALLAWAPGWLVFAAVAAPWFIAVQERFPDFEHYFFVVQHFQRFVSTGFNNPQPWWFYPLVLLLLTLPWSPWLLALLRRRRGPEESRHSELRILMLAWIGTVTVFFSLPSSKLVGYILPALPPLAFLLAEAVHPIWAGRPIHAHRRWLVATALVAAAACVCAVVAAHFFQPKSNQALAENLRASRKPGESVVFLDNLYYDVMFYARLDAPVSVVDRWLPEEVAKDSWHRELVDAARFAPADSARHLLLPDELEPALCSARSSWVVGPWPVGEAPAWLAAQPPAYQSGSTALWHVVASTPRMRGTLHCREPIN